MTALIVGSGAQGRVILDIVRAQGRHAEVAFVDDNRERWGSRVNDARVIGGLDDVLRQPPPDVEIIVALGNPVVRARLAAKIHCHGIPLFNAIHPSAVVMPTVAMGSGIMVGATAVINSDARLADNVIVNTGAIVEHDCALAECVAVAPSGHLGGRVTLDRSVFVSTGAIVLSRVSIGEASVVAAGAVVTRDLPARVLAMGIPARIVEHLDADFNWNRVL